MINQEKNEKKMGIHHDIKLQVDYAHKWEKNCPRWYKKHKLYSSEFVFKGVNSTFGWSSSGRKDHSYLLSQILSQWLEYIKVIIVFIRIRKMNLDELIKETNEQKLCLKCYQFTR